MKEPKLQSVKWDGRQINKPGMYSGIPLSVYHGQKILDGPSVSSSGLRTLRAKSPAHFYCEWSGNPDCIQQEDKKHFIMGRAIHHLILGENFFSKMFAVRPPEFDSWRTKEAKQWKAEAEATGRAILVPDDVAIIRGIAKTLGKNSIVKAGALKGLVERSIFLKDKETGLWIKVRPDVLPTHSGDFVDLKTTTSVVYDDLVSAIYDLGYAQQGALVRRVAREVLNIPNPSFSLIFVEKTPPYCERVMQIKDNELDRAEKVNRKALDTIARCIDSGEWPGPGGDRADAEYIELREWQQKKLDDWVEFSN